MEELLTRCFLYAAAVAWVSLHFIITAIKRSKFNPKRQPPGPFPLPLVGNIFSLGAHPLKNLTGLSKTYGPVMSLHLGCQTTVVITSASMAKEVLLTNDISFANRYVPDAITALEHHESSIGLRQADARWKMYRKICFSHIFSNNRLDATQLIRKKKIQELLSYVETSITSGKSVNVGQATFTASLNNLSNTIFSVDLGDPNSEIARDFKRLFIDLIAAAAIPNLADAFPMLKPLDPQRIKKRTAAIMDKIMTIFDKMIRERLEERETADNPTSCLKNDVLDALLTMVQESKELQLHEVRHLMLDLFVAGSETTSTFLEWAMTELMRNPNKMKKAQAELEERIGKGNSMEEEHIPQLPYLQAVVKETLRMHPSIPFLLPRIVKEDTPLGNFIVAKNTQIIVNVSAIQKDPTLWNNPESFEPERFLGSTIDYKGKSFEFLPFGSGRRTCPGIPLASKMNPWMLGSLIHKFDWNLENGVTPETLSMDEKLGFTLVKAKPLCVIPSTK